MSDVLARLEQKALEGISPSLPHQQGRLWRDGENVIFHESSVQPIPGQRALFSKPSTSPVSGLLEREDSAGTKELFFGTLDSLYSWTATGGVVVEGTAYTLAADATNQQRKQFWSMETWGNWVLATNGKDVPQIMTSATGFRATTASDRDFTTAEIFAALGSFNLAINTSNGGKMLQWTDTDQPENFIESDISNAGNINIRELENEIIAAAHLAGGISVYSNDSMALVQQIGGDLIFAHRPLIRGIGVVGKQAVVSVGALNYGMSYRGLWEADGNDFNYIDDPEVHDEIFEDINMAQISKSVVWYDKLLDSVVFWFPSSNSLVNDKALMFNRKSRVFTKLGFGRSFAVESSIFPFGITGDENGNVFAQSVVGAPSSAAGAAVITDPTIVLTAGLGVLGFGQLGFGGYYGGDG